MVSKIISTDLFIEKARKIHGEEFDYSKTIYKGSHSKIIVICKIHGEFEVLATNHLSGCRFCGYDKPKYNKSSLTEFIQKANKVHNNKYSYTKSEYNLDKDYVIISCIKHGDFYQNARSHLNGCGCPKCKLSKGESKILEWLDEHKVEYKHQQRFTTCKDKRPLPFDFYLPDHNICIEFDGIQHFESRSFGSDKSDTTQLKDFNNTIKRDNIKTSWCINNNIELLRIPYYKEPMIDEILTHKLILVR